MDINDNLLLHKIQSLSFYGLVFKAFFYIVLLCLSIIISFDRPLASFLTAGIVIMFFMGFIETGILFTYIHNDQIKDIQRK